MYEKRTISRKGVGRLKRAKKGGFRGLREISPKRA